MKDLLRQIAVSAVSNKIPAPPPPGLFGETRGFGPPHAFR